MGISNSKISVIYNGVDVEMFHPRMQHTALHGECPVGENRLRIGMIGRIEDWKRQIDVIEAAGLLSKRIDLQVFVVGEVWRADLPDRSSLQARIIELGPQENIVFTGFRSDIPQIMAGLDVIVVPSIDEPFGRVTIEAMALGKPVIGTLSGGTPEIIQNGISGILVPVKNPKAIANALERISKNREFAETLGRNARTRVLDTFSINHHVKQIQDLYLGSL